MRRAALLAASIVVGLSAAGPVAAETNEAASAYPDSDGQLVWDTFRGRFRMLFTLDPPATEWVAASRQQPAGAAGDYTSGDYRLRIRQEHTVGKDACLLHYELTRVEGRPFRVLENRIECKTSYSGVYKTFQPGAFSQQHYRIDLPFHIKDRSRAESDQPVFWMQQTDGRNTLTVGMLDQVPNTVLEGSTYDVANGGEASGIANSYVRVAFARKRASGEAVTVFKDGIYVNADPDVSWFEALEGYSAAVDAARNFKARRASDWALNPMWHSWYAHAEKIDEPQIRDDTRRARQLGVTTIEIDAGWNMPREVNYGFENEGDYEFDRSRFPDAKGMIDELHAAGQRVVLHVSPLVMGKNSTAWASMKDCLIAVDGKPRDLLDPRLKKSHDYLLMAWEKLFTRYGVDGLWYDFLDSIPPVADPPAAGMEVVSPDLQVGYTRLMQALYEKSLALNPDAVIILRRPAANLNAKTFCTHVWPMDTPQDYNMNRRDVVYLKTFGPGVITHACCTSWAISESDVNVARHMASVALAGVPAFSVKLPESPASHNAIIKAWLAFYERHKRDLVLGRMTPLLPTPPSAALRIEGERQAFFGLFEAVPGLVEVTKPVTAITLVNAFSRRTTTRLEGVQGEWRLELYDHLWQPISEAMLKTDADGGLNINVTGPSECHAIVLTKKS